jgi:hypothetical protein
MAKLATYDRFDQLPEDAQRAFEKAIAYYKRTFPDHASQVGHWSDLAQQTWTETMQYARPEVTGMQRGRGLIVGARHVVFDMALRWQKTGKRKKR